MPLPTAIPKKYLFLIIAIVAAIALLAGALWERHKLQTSQNSSARASLSASNANPNTPITLAEISKNDGKDGHKCYVAVNGKVYEIEQGRLWQNGEHVTSGGMAYCGRDLSDIITKSPHGTSKLETLTQVGTLKK